MDTLLALISALIVIVFVGGLSLLAHWGRKNRAAEITLVVILLFLSFLVLVTGALIAFVGASGVVPAADLPRELSYSAAAVTLLAGLAGLALCVPPLVRITRRRREPVRYDAAEPASFATAGRAGEAGPGGGWWSDPPVFFGLWMFVVVLAYNVLNILTFALMPDQVSDALTAAGRLSVTTVLLTQLPFVVIALLGVGLGVRRNLRETLARLGYGPITLRQLGIVAAFIAGALVLSIASNALFAVLQPDLYEQVGAASEGLFGTEGLSPVSAVLFGLLVGLGAALGEETLFRGALQPGLGIVLVSILFASMHAQYGPSIILIYLFLFSVALGFLRRYVNTTATFLTHAGYNFTLVILSYFFSV